MSLTAQRRLTGAMPWAVLAVVVAVDTASNRIVVSGAYPTAAVVASTMTTVRGTGYVAGVSLGLAAASGWWNDHVGPADFALRFSLATVLAAVAVVAARIRVQREDALAHMTVVAETVQQAVLRTIPPQVGTVGLATQYQSATRAALVGGDLFEVADTRRGVRVIVGDVRGKGMEAVQLAATVLAAFRRAAFDRHDLEGVATDLDEVVRAVAGDEDFVTALLVEFGPGGTITLLNRGHHPPLLTSGQTGATGLVDTGEPYPPLGLGGGHRSVSTTWAPGERLLLYTDGLVEARNRTGQFFPLPECSDDLSAGSVDDALQRLLTEVQEFSGHEATDDIALLLAENRDTGPT